MKHIRKQYKYIIGLSVFLILLNACQTFQQGREDRHTTTPLATPQFLSPLPENVSDATLIGQLISLSQKGPLSNTVVRLARVFWDEEKKEGVYVLEGARSPSCITDENGFFVFLDLEPADYVMVIGDVYGKYMVVSDSDRRARIFTLEKGKITNIGQLQVEFP
ncbi:MAG: hypothetical protein QXS54_10115 [Candidatus Methanomethylicaceae archaeon]